MRSSAFYVVFSLAGDSSVQLDDAGRVEHGFVNFGLVRREFVREESKELLDERTRVFVVRHTYTIVQVVAVPGITDNRVTEAVISKERLDALGHLPCGFLFFVCRRHGLGVALAYRVDVNQNPSVCGYVFVLDAPSDGNSAEMSVLVLRFVYGVAPNSVQGNKHIGIAVQFLEGFVSLSPIRRPVCAERSINGIAFLIPTDGPQFKGSSEETTTQESRIFEKRFRRHASPL